MVGKPAVHFQVTTAQSQRLAAAVFKQQMLTHSTADIVSRHFHHLAHIIAENSICVNKHLFAEVVFQAHFNLSSLCFTTKFGAHECFI